ncbi:hypothetical protein ACFYKX_03590 [Cytobacillus sp. FJAT-54145]|uniref:Preprotein translocase subunit SecA n=1 Tax=Cytobacillus spartinae TaxID=3299023 RepID=A0ABW6K691_9BACI
MFVVSFFDNRNLLLNQFRNQVPSVGDSVSIKGRKGKVASVDTLEDNKIHVQVALDPVSKGKAAAAADTKKKKK